MLKMFRVMIASLALTAVMAVNANAAFNILVQPVSGPSFSTYNSGLTANTINLFGGVPFSNPSLTLNYSVTNTPALGQFSLDNLSFVYFGNGNPITLQVLITENNANFIGNGNPLTGFASFNVAAGSNTASTMQNTTTFTPGTGANSIVFPNTNFPVANTTYSQNTSFISGGATGTVSTLFQFTIQPGSNVAISSGGGFGSFGVTDGTLVPVPATALLGLIAVPTLAIIRRRRKA